MMNDIALLLLRVSFGLTMAVSHGLGKLMDFPAKAASFSDPLGISSPVSMALVVFAEFLCAGLVAAGLFTRLASIPVAFAMFVAFFIVHSGGAWGDKEAAFLFCAAFTALAFTGGGRFSADRLFFGKRW